MRHAHPTIMAGDFNTSKPYMQRKFKDFQQHTALQLMQPISPTFVNSRGHTSLLDFFLVDTALLQHAKLTKQLHSSQSPSDHVPVRLSLRLTAAATSVEPPGIPQEFRSGHALRLHFKEHMAGALASTIRDSLQQHPGPDPRQATPEQLATHLTSVIHDAAEPMGMLVKDTDPPPPAARPLHMRRPFKLPQHALLLKKQIRLLAASGDAPNILKQLRKEFKAEVSWAKIRTAWLRGKQLADGFKHSPAQAWAQFKRQNQVFKSTAINLTQWHQHYQSLFTQPHGAVVHDWAPYVRSIHHTRRQEAHRQLSAEITLGELIKTIHQVNQHAAQGADAIPTEVIALYYEDEQGSRHYPVLQQLVPLYNLVLQGQQHPRSWDLAVISPLHKGKGEIDDVGAYRPLSLSTVFYRFFMAVMTRRLSAALEKFGLLPDTQYGFRENRGACHANLVLQEACLFREGDEVVPTHVAFLDLSQAYDRVHHASLFAIMKHMGLPEHFIHIIARLYQHARFCIQTPHGYTPVTPYTRGLRQGCPMSPVLFCIYFSVLDLWLKQHAPNCGKMLGLPTPLQNVCYADDTTLLSDTRQQLQSLVTATEDCCDKLHLVININPGKSGIVSFNHSGRGRPITTRSGTIQNCTHYNHLGVIFTKTGTWNKAYNHRYELAKSAFHVLRNEVRAHKLSNIWAASMVFNAKVMSTMLYGVQIWGWDKFHQYDWLQNDWQSLHVRTLKAAMHLPASTPDIPLWLESGMWPMMYYAISRTFKFAGDLHLAKSQWIDHLLALNLPNGFNHRMNTLIQLLPQEHINELDRLEMQFDNLLHDLLDDPRDEVVRARKVTSYLSWVRGDTKLHRRPYFYKLPLSHSEYRILLMTRLMMVNVPMFSGAEFHLRGCPLCTSQFGDIEHIIMECPFFQAIRQSAFNDLGVEDPHISWLFTNRDSRAHEFIAEVMSLYRSATGR